mmetsp:Transcript_24395/g.59197  ORF Transcript_24395/g.59197 Transcript_24395/m.59197 type:complete len:231 (+) Transcript_24395:464-1156(+)
MSNLEYLFVSSGGSHTHFPFCCLVASVMHSHRAGPVFSSVDGWISWHAKQSSSVFPGSLRPSSSRNCTQIEQVRWQGMLQFRPVHPGLQGGNRKKIFAPGPEVSSQPILDLVLPLRSPLERSSVPTGMSSPSSTMGSLVRCLLQLVLGMYSVASSSSWRSSSVCTETGTSATHSPPSCVHAALHPSGHLFSQASPQNPFSHPFTVHIPFLSQYWLLHVSGHMLHTPCPSR